MCKYCEGEENIIDKIDGGLGIVIGLEDNQNLKILVEDKHLIFKINYCPICGRYLDGEEYNTSLIRVSKKFVVLPEKIKCEIKKEMYPDLDLGDIQFMVRVHRDGNLGKVKNIIDNLIT